VIPQRQEAQLPVASATRPSETTAIHTRLLKCSLEVEESRSYWRHTSEHAERATPERAFEEYWFGARSLPRVKLFLTNFRARFDAFPTAFEALQRLSILDLESRRLICHWHLQLSDPLYRAFTGDFLRLRRDKPRPEVYRDAVITWVGDQGPGRWTMATRIQFASKLLTATLAAGLVSSNRDPRPLSFPAIPDGALTYLLYLLREVDFEGTLLDNPYLASVGLVGAALDDRLRGLEGVGYRRQGENRDLSWEFADLSAWVDHVATRLEVEGEIQ